MDLTVLGVDIVTVTPEAARRNRDFEMYFWAEIHLLFESRHSQ